MDNKLYVGNLSFHTTEDDLRTMFAQAGKVESVSLIKDRDSGRSKGFAFIEMSTQSEAEQAIKLFDGKSLDDRQIKVNIARPREERNSGSRGGRDSFRDRNRRRSGGQRRY